MYSPDTHFKDAEQLPAQLVATIKQLDYRLEHPEVDQDLRNRRVLETGGWAGRILLDAYEVAKEHDPRIAKAEVLSSPRPFYLPAFVEPGWFTRTGRPAVYLPLGPSAPWAWGKLLQNQPTSAALIAEQLDLESDEMDDATALCFGGLHEFRHVLQHLDFQGTVGQFLINGKFDELSVPLPHHTMRYLQSRRGKLWMVMNWGVLSNQYDVATPDELLKKKQIAYRQMTDEKDADQWAAGIMKARNVKDGIWHV